MKQYFSRCSGWFLAALLVAACPFVGVPSAAAQMITAPVFEARQANAAPSLRIIERTQTSITFEMTADWQGSLSESVREDLLGTIIHATGGIPWLTEPIRLNRPEVPRVTILASEFDEIPLPFEVDEDEDAGLSGAAAAVESVGIERRQPTGTFVARLLRIDRESGTIRRYHRIVARVEIGAGEAAYNMSFPQNPHLDVTESVLATGTWFKVPVMREGMYRIDRAFLEGLDLNPDAIDPNQVKVYGNSGAPLPALNSAPRIPDLAENRVFVVGGGDGRFNSGDAVYFFGRASSGWRWDTSTASHEWRHYINPFSTQNYYFIRIDGPGSTQISTAPTPSGTPTVLSRVDGRIFVEEDLPGGMVDREGGGSGLDWLGRDLTPTRSRITVLDTLPPDLGQGTIRYRGRFAAAASQSVQMAFVRNESVFASAALSSSGQYTHFGHATRTFNEPAVANQPLRVDLRMSPSAGTPTGWIDYIAAVYPQDLRATNDYLRFATPGGEEGVFEFVLSGFTGEPQVWDVTDVGHERRLAVTASGNSYRVKVAAVPTEESVHREIVAFRPSSSRIRLLDPESATAVANQNVHGLPGHPDYVIVAAAPFMAAAEELAAHRAADGLQPAVVDIQQIYNEFSGGQVDPRGLRDFLRFLYDRSPGPEPVLRYAVLFGDGNYDYRGIRPGGLENNFIPTYQSEESASGINSYTSDDYFGLLAPNEGVWGSSGAGLAERVDIGIGRLPARDAQEAAEMIAKIKRYEDPSTRGAWRTRYTLLSDDHLPNFWDRDLHLQNSEVVSDTVRAHAPALNFDKIYMSMYALQQTALGARRPEATAASLRSLEEGTLVWNYSGHGGPTGLSDAKLITRDEIRQLANFDRLTVAVTATCSFGRYDLRDERSAGEDFLLNPNGGAVAIFTTSRLVFASTNPGNANLGLNVTLNRYLLQREPDGQPRRLGDIYRLTKAHDTGAQFNNRKFNLLGDPGMRFGLPEQPVRITRINDMPVGGRESGDLARPVLAELSGSSGSGEARSVAQAGTRESSDARMHQARAGDGAVSMSGFPELRALELATIEGEVLDVDGELDTSFSGEVEVLVYDVERTFSLPPEVDILHTDGTFRMRSDLLYRGRATVSSGTWEVQFIVPADVSYAGESARIAAYVRSAVPDGMGFTEDVLISTTSGPPLGDNEGPRIRMFLNDTTFVSGGLTSSQPLLIAKLTDDSGINMAGVGVGHEMLLVINGNEAEAINVGSFYQSDLDTFRSGSLRYQLPTLEAGPNTISLTAWDVVNNSSMATLDFIVEDSDRLRIEHAYPYPNPTTGPTRFVFEHNQSPGVAASVQIRIFTLNGRPVRTLDGHETLPDGILPGSPVQIPWDGRDEDLDELATGIYLYRVRVEVDHGDGERRVAERIERLAIIR